MILYCNARERTMSKYVKKVTKLKYTDGNGETYLLKNAIVIDLTGSQSLEKLLEEALTLEEVTKTEGEGNES